MDSETTKKKSDKINHKKKVKYSFFTFVLIICIIELAVSDFNNILKNISFLGKIRELEEKKTEEFEKNKQLKSEIENFNSETTLESIARNNLKMAGQNEILVIINKPQENEQEKDSQAETNH